MPSNCVGIGAGDERQPLELPAGGPHHQRDVFRRKALELRAHRQIAAARHAGVAGLDLNLVGARRFGALRQFSSAERPLRM